MHYDFFFFPKFQNVGGNVIVNNLQQIFGKLEHKVPPHFDKTFVHEEGK